MLFRMNKPNMPNAPEDALPWAVVFLLLFLCMSACSSLLNVIDRVKEGQREEEGPPQKLAPVTPWLDASQPTQEPVTIAKLPMPTLPPETVKPISFPYSQGQNTRVGYT
jgi:hypothetical protein